MRCLNCNYKLVLLSNRRKYKCAKCSRLFPQKSVENKEFRNWNGFQRKLDKENLKPVKKVRVKLSDEERVKRIKESQLKYRLNNRDKLLADSRERVSIWLENNRERYNSRRRDYWNKNKDKLINRAKELKLQNPKYNLARKIRKWRQKQKMLALRELEFLEKKASKRRIQLKVPTLVHYHQLYL